MRDQAARDLAISNHTTTLLVEAAAGTGKTTLTVQRIMAMILAGTSVERIAAVTFTVKAAGELKERLRVELSELRGNPHAQEALNNLDHMAVNTIHGFCADLLRALPVEAKLEPGFRVTDELEQSAMRREFWTSWLREALSRETPKELDVFLEFGDLSSTESGQESKRVDLFDLFDELIDAPSPAMEIRFGTNVETALSEKRNALIDVAEMAQAALGSCSDQSDKLLPHLQNIASLTLTLPDDMCTVEGVEWLRANTGIGDKTGGRAQAWDGVFDVKAAKKVVDAARQAIDDLQNAVFTATLDAVTRWVLSAVKQFRENQRAIGQIGFDELLRATRDMLRDSRTARRIFKTQFSYLHVDEFQDTDPVQTEILFFLCELDDEHASGWRDVNLKAGKLFVVGDPKQSIYRFRGADLRIYTEAKQKIESAGRVLQIHTNFRSDGKILREVNAIFKVEMTGQSPDAPNYVELTPDEGNPVSDFAVEILRARPYDPKTTASQLARLEAEAIADHIQLTLSQGILHTPKGGNPRQLLPEDIAILVRSSTNVERLTDALRSAEIPFVSSLDDSFVEQTEIEGAVTLLAALANPQDTMSVIGTLRSPWFGISDEELLMHQYDVGTFVYSTARQADTPTAQALETLREWREKLRTQAPSAVMEWLITESHVPLIYGMKSQGASRYRNFGRLVGVMRRLEKGGETSPLRMVERLRSLSKLPESAETESHGSVDAVRIMTIHKAKGLEFPFVYFYRMVPGKKTSSIVLATKHEHLNMGIRSGGAQSEFFKDLAQEEHTGQSHEELRCLYVAMTRACRRLIIPIGWNDSHPVLNARYLRATDVDCPEEVRVSPATLTVSALRSPDAPRRTLSTDNTSEADTSREHYRHWKERRADALRLRAAIAPIRTASEKETVRHDSRSGRSGAMRIGSFVHAALDAFVEHRDTDRASRIAMLRERVTSVERERAEDVLSKDICEELSAVLDRARAIYSEMPFTRMEAGEIVEGKIDLLIRTDEDRWILVDHKTDDVVEDGVLSRARNYAPQLRAYSAAVEEIIGKPPDEIWLHFLRLRRIHRLTE